MTIIVDGKELEITENGYLTNPDDWDEKVAEVIAKEESITLSERHWDVVNYLRDEYMNNKGNQPNTRAMVKEIGKIWGEKIDTKALFDLFPGNPSKQAGRIAGIPESRRKGGY
uniref:Sulfurtransferase n=1 Tax=Candidatus Kentrum sp. LFY TaxID=2126342 RepID=A0A450WCF9_9GAMM|nr:MAG: tRNA 2-thiouridine synthesizing protein E [Candidatus Kentron sp. LFY]VFJ89449.1 MAG: tRNA 2-thiouridine synthesizing protein E [Candidatus Kentron sp. LFY]VFK14685.1 MAG: tRNA 2-thiouridine synthesizing protein E [Candidatus Kentron sp. LFY]